MRLPESARVALLPAAFVAAVTALHLHLNTDWASLVNDLRPEAKRKLHVAYIPVT